MVESLFSGWDCHAGVTSVMVILPMPPDTDRAVSAADLDDPSALGNVDDPPSGQPPGRRPDVVHELPPLVRTRSAGRIRRADRPMRFPLEEQLEYQFLQLGRGRVRGGHLSIVSCRIGARAYNQVDNRRLEQVGLSATVLLAIAGIRWGWW